MEKTSSREGSHPQTRRVHTFLLALAVLSFVLSGCTKTRLTKVHDPDYVGRTFATPVVVAETSDLRMRQLLEDALANELTHRGISVRTSLQLLPPTRDYTAEERLAVLRQAGVDSVIVVAGESGVTEVYVPVTGSTTNTSGTVQTYGNQATFQAHSNTTYQGGYYVQKPWAKVTTTVIDLGNGHIAWLGSSQTNGNALASFDDVRRSYCRAVTAQLVTDKLFGPRAREAPFPNAPAPAGPTMATLPSAPASQTSPPPWSTDGQGLVMRGQSTDLANQLEGCVIVGNDGTFLGRITSNEVAADSILNEVGRYGSQISPTSIFNNVGRFGSNVSPLSAFNEIASEPPSIFCKDSFAAHLTTNQMKSPAVDPRLLVGLLHAQH